MTFVLAKDGRHDDVVAAFRRYREYLESVKDSFPPSAYALATSDWYYDHNDHRCPHDAWLETLCLTEPSSGSPHQKRTLSLQLRLLGALHDGYVQLRYPRVFSYRLDIHDGEMGHRNWRYDEFRVSEEGRLIHEIEWWAPIRPALG